MATDVLLGRDCILEVAPDAGGSPGTYEIIDLARDVTLNREKTEIDVTNRQSAASGYQATSQGLKSFSVEFEAHKEAAGETPSAGMDLLAQAWESNETVWVKVTSGNETITAACKVGGGNEEEPLDDAVTISYTLTNIGEVTVT